MYREPTPSQGMVAAIWSRDLNSEPFVSPVQAAPVATLEAEAAFATEALAAEGIEENSNLGKIASAVASLLGRHRGES